MNSLNSLSLEPVDPPDESMPGDDALMSQEPAPYDSLVALKAAIEFDDIAATLPLLEYFEIAHRTLTELATLDSDSLEGASPELVGRTLEILAASAGGEDTFDDACDLRELWSIKDDDPTITFYAMDILCSRLAVDLAGDESELQSISMLSDMASGYDFVTKNPYDDSLLGRMVTWAKLAADPRPGNPWKPDRLA